MKISEKTLALLLSFVAVILLSMMAYLVIDASAKKPEQEKCECVKTSGHCECCKMWDE